MTISKIDFQSLENLAAILDDQTVDISTDGSVGAPYEDGIWKSASSWLGTSANYESLIKLFERTAFSMYMRQGYMANKIRLALPGLERLKMTHEDEKETVATLNKVIEFVKSTRDKWYSSHKEITSSPEKGDAIYSDLERSVFFPLLETPNITLTAKTGLNWLIRKIDAFIEVAYGLSDEDKLLLFQINSALRTADQWQNLCEIWNKPESQNKTGLQLTTEIAQGIEELIDSLVSKPPEFREKIGLVLPFTFSCTEYAHTTTLGICQNPDFSFTLIRCNAGLGAEVESMSPTMNIYNPLTPYGQPVTEYGPFNRTEISNFLKELQRKKISRTTAGEAANEFKSIFEKLPKHVKEYKIPTKRLQVSGNCTLRSPQEWVLFCLQKCDKVHLANHLLQVSPSRDTWDSPSIELVEPLIKSA